MLLQLQIVVHAVNGVAVDIATGTQVLELQNAADAAAADSGQYCQWHSCIKMACKMAGMCFVSLHMLLLLLLQIVANAVNGVDVDKLDYLRRDALMTGIGATYDFSALLDTCTVSSMGK
jgi:hypothetical protein